MSESLAAFRNNGSNELRLSTQAQIGSLLELSFGVYWAFRLRTMRPTYPKTVRAIEKPAEVRFADDGTLTPSKWSDTAAYFFFSIGGLFLGGETGFLIGTTSGSRTIMRDTESRERIEKAFKNCRIDVMKKEIQALEGKGTLSNIFGWVISSTMPGFGK
ncbi:uncharacterized protein BDR25DRAFT_327707 [Lindgomyces ingoldianus]|uniref:Uncharacterized protein n=1 Tax=Lindgomyces ingoldianus TaxID=673940 RepID=A0ACB6QJ70_9PLEO|nr:uncharacterized protein BDR25DRAFT_327707 [Lindgomyces ingoldianus]KAF2467069.1 hypothetical protein BDR25DRAFT_327707 [Lindgomyces ingoldianus]